MGPKDPKKVERPEIVTDSHLMYLDELRASGATNMLGAGTYLEAAFHLTKEEARTVLVYWMQTFEDSQR